MFDSITSRLALATTLILVPATVSLADPPRGYWVQSSGYYDQFPYPPAIGGRSEYSEGRPVVYYYGPTGELVSTPLRPKSLYYSTPFITPEGYSYYPTSITLIPDDRRRRAIELPRTYTPSTFRYDGGPVDPVPPVRRDNR